MFRRMLAVLALTAAALTTPASAHADTTYRGEGDDVVRIHATKKPGLIRFTHDGESSFIVHAYPRIGSYGDLLFNEIGRYKGKALLPVGTRLVTVHADGAWTLTRN
ncbi:hypothetical protein AB0C14_04940 [Microbispora hainanensis]|uniref:hypothetical protein n=1 Tax=Microbispora hainanensis TaxID=568844 RepID=UPI0033E33AE7